MIRKKAREAAFQYLYQLDEPGVGNEPHSAFSAHAKHFELEQDTLEFSTRLVQAVLGNLPAIDAMISKHAKEWRVERLGAVEKALLRMGTAELMYFKDVPASVTLDEIVELAKDFAEAEAPAFLNGILDPVSKEPASVSGKVESR
ncbi:MAG: transcription antitermination factor NusB [Bdellovibrionales bacterium]|nr:transcription antitermination factor NusB [Bdellovibrionales bacterium]